MTAVALLSGGLDSTVATTQAHRQDGVILALTFDYGQRAAERERRSARGVAAELGIRQRTISLDFLGELTTTALVDRGQDLPLLEEDQLGDAAGAAADSMRGVWVPNRNGLFIAIAAAYAESLGADQVVVGFNREEARTFPDNSAEFLKRTSAALSLSTLSKVQLASPTMGLDKVGIVQLGYEIDAPLRQIWSCYEGGPEPCRRCESCKRLARALDQAGFARRFDEEWIDDPEVSD